MSIKEIWIQMSYITKKLRKKSQHKKERKKKIITSKAGPKVDAGSG